MIAKRARCPAYTSNQVRLRAATVARGAYIAALFG
jgi:hypothetical protein